MKLELIIGIVLSWGVLLVAPATAQPPTSATGQPPAKFKICVLDFTTIDQIGQKRFLNTSEKTIKIPPQDHLTTLDHLTISRKMQGMVRLLETMDSLQTNELNRAIQTRNNAAELNRARQLYLKTVQGTARPVIIGADYLTAYLGRHHDIFSCMDTNLVTQAMNQLQQEPDFPRNFMLKLRQMTGCTHLIYGQVSDIKQKSNSFRGYGIATQTTNYQLDVIIKLVDLNTQGTIYSNVFTGNYREQRPVSGTQFDNNIFQTLLTSALEQAAEELYDICRPGRKNRIHVTPILYELTVIPVGGLFFSAEQIKIYIDGQAVGNGQISRLLPAGAHQVLLQAPGYNSRRVMVDLKGNQSIKIKLQKNN